MGSLPRGFFQRIWETFHLVCQVSLKQCSPMKMHFFFLISLVGHVGVMCGGPEPPLAVGAPEVRQGAPLLKPAIHSHLDVTVGVPAKRRR